MTTRINNRHPAASDTVPRTSVAPPARPRRRHLPLALVTWAAGAGLFLCLGLVVATAALVGPAESVPPSVAADQQARTELAAGQVRRALDGGLSDLAAVAAGIRKLADADTPERLLSALVSTRARYRGAVYVGPAGEVRARAGADVDTTGTGAAPTVLVRAPRVLVAVPVTGARAGVLVAELDPQTLSTPLSLAGPGDTRLLDWLGRGVGTSAGGPTVALPAARPGHALRDLDGRPTVAAWAPVPGRTGLTVVTDRSEPSGDAERRELLLFGVLIATLTIVIFGWLYVRVVGPLSALATAADRLTRGDVGDPVIVRRYDLLGLVARDLERIRRHLLRRN
jgi:hypothetical protein